MARSSKEQNGYKRHRTRPVPVSWPRAQKAPEAPPPRVATYKLEKAVLVSIPCRKIFCRDETPRPAGNSPDGGYPLGPVPEADDSRRSDPDAGLLCRIAGSPGSPAVYTGAMTALARWTEVLRCPDCALTGVATLCQAQDARFGTSIEHLPPGFTLVSTEYGDTFYCVACDRPARASTG